MARLVLRGFLQRKLRVALTAIAIALGVALMAGTYILTDTINQSFAGIFKTAAKGDSVVVSPSEALGSRTQTETSPITEQMLARVRSTPGVAQAAGGIFTEGTFLDTKRKRLTSGHSPGFISAVVPPRFESFKPVKGHLPSQANEVAIDEATAERKDVKIGQQIIVAGRAAARQYTVVGVIKFASGESFGGAGVALLTLSEAQRVVGEPGRFDQIDVAAAPGVSDEQLRAHIRAVLPRTVDVRTGTQQAEKNTSNLEENLSFLRTFLLVFAYIALVVGAFIIFNTFSITIAQRTREFALLRMLGASRRQIMQTVIGEGLLLGVLGAVLGLFAGIGLAPALDQLFKLFGADIPDNGTVLETRTIVVSLAIGIVVTVLAGLPSALRATRVPPIAAMREGVEIPPRQALTRGRYAVPILMALIAIRLIVAIANHEGTGTIVIIAAIGVLIAAVRLRQRARGRNYRVVPFLARVIGVLVTWRGITGVLARENTIRQPGRTMVTAAALTIGIALVAFISVFAAGVKSTINQTVSRSFAGNLIVENSQNSEEHGIPTGVAQAVAKVPGVARVTPFAFAIGRVKGTSSNAVLTAVEPSTFASVYRIEWASGSSETTLSSLNDGTVVVKKAFAKSNHIAVGQTISVLTPTTKTVSLRVVGIVKESFGLLQDLTITRTLADSSFGLREDALDFVSYAPGASNAQVQPAVDRLLDAQFPQARSRTSDQFRKEKSEQINSVLALIYVLLALSVIVSLFGIVNTLILSIYERTRELGMMRAIGTSRRQVRQMIRYESVITALIGGVFGLVIGLVAAIIVAVWPLSGSGYLLTIPVGTLIVLLVIAAIAGLLAAQLPARRAAKLNVLDALAAD
ncbi:MAG TPA: FtsX-like permease family protein [Solirubrobacteraceae bacterium]|jgi:putative ABC transport system permease protein|nr:FtsX-like permease family protein [Solirubrobacteraceae bacterium]